MLVVDGLNVIGSRPDGWWRDRGGAKRALVELLRSHAQRAGEPLVVFFDGRPIELAPSGAPVEVRFAPGGRDAADDAIVAFLRAAPPGTDARVVTSDAALARRARALGAAVEPAGAFRRRLEEE